MKLKKNTKKSGENVKYYLAIFKQVENPAKKQEMKK